MTGWLQDLRFAGRMMRRRPGYAVLVAAVLALAIGANTSIFSVLRGVLLRPLPYPSSERLVQLWETDRLEGGQNSISPLNLLDWAERTRTLDHLAGYRYANVNLTGEGEPRRLVAALVNAEFFPAMGVVPAAGRGFLAAEDAPGSAPVVVVGYGLWQRQLGADRSIVGRTIDLDGEPHTVVGVMPAGFEAPSPAVEVWLPLRLDPVGMRRGYHYLQAVARLRDGATLEAARSDLAAIADALSEENPDTNRDSTVSLVPLHEQRVGNHRAALLVLMAAVGMMLLVACANVANLFLARAADRGREVAIRAALGAGRLRLVRQFLVESLFLSLAGGAAGAALSWWGIDLVADLASGSLPRVKEIVIDPVVLAFAGGISVLTGLLFGLPPALQASRSDLTLSLKEGGRGVAARRRRLQDALVIAEVALAVVLLVGGTLLIRSFQRLAAVSTGFDGDVLTVGISLPPARYPEPSAQAEFFRRARQQVEALPGVVVAGAAQEVPFAGSRTSESFAIVGKETQDNGPVADLRLVTPGYQRAMGIPLLRGRYVQEQDVDGSQPVAVVNETFAKRYFPGEDPIGREIRCGVPPVSRTIVGVIGDVHHLSLTHAGEPEMHVPHAQRPTPEMYLAVRASVPAASLVRSIGQAVREVDPQIPIFSARTMKQRLASEVAAERTQAVLVALFAGTALLLAVVGVYGVMSYGVSRRTREFGIRIALGAKRRSVVRLVAQQGMRLALGGMLLGLAAALGLSRVLAGLLFGIAPGDPPTYLTAAVLLTAAAMLACILPALRATRVDPVEALRSE